MGGHKSNVHTLSFINDPQCPLLDYIKNGQKIVEGRKNSGRYFRIKEGDYIRFITKGEQDVYVIVTFVHKYKTLEDYLKSESLTNTLPCAKTFKEGVKIYNQWSKETEREELRKRFGHGFLGFGIKVVNIHYINVKEPWATYIKNGDKTVEGRLNRGRFKMIDINDIIIFNKNIRCKIVDKEIYGSFHKMLEQEGLNKVLPNIDKIKDGVKIYRLFYNEQHEIKEGVLAIKIELIN